MLEVSVVKDVTELNQILTLQKQNLPSRIDAAEMRSQGFVTVDHTLEVLQQMHDLAPSIIVKDNDAVQAYALVMMRECRQIVPVLEPMFALLDQLSWNGQPLNSYHFYVMGQICVAKEYRSKGLVEMMYHKHREIYQPSMDFIVTEIATRNLRSMRAHEKIGFKTIHIHRDELDEWAVVLWDWS